jgi:hypothetical protein
LSNQKSFLGSGFTKNWKPVSPGADGMPRTPAQPPSPPVAAIARQEVASSRERGEDHMVGEV